MEDTASPKQPHPVTDSGAGDEGHSVTNPVATQAPDVVSLTERLNRAERLNRILGGVSGALAAVFLVTIAVLGTMLAVRPASTPVAEPAPVSTQEQSAQPETPAQRVPDLARRDPSDPLAVGAIDAPVVIIEWFDYRCPYCAAFANDTMPAIMNEYVETGKVRWEFHDVVFFGDESLAAAVAGRAAAAQGRFLEYIAVLFESAKGAQGHPDLPREKLVAFAQQAGVPDMARFVADLDSPELIQAVERSHQDAVSLGVQSVPTFVIGQTVLQGAYPLADFRAALEKELSSKTQ